MRRLVLFAILAAAAAACTPDVADPVTTPPPPPPPATPSNRWSDPATWAPLPVPGDGFDATIPAGKTVELDVSPPPLNRLTVDGTLLVAPDRDLQVTAKEVWVNGTFRIGTPETPHLQRFTLTLTGTDVPVANGVGTKVLAVFPGGVLDLHGARRTGWTRLAATASPGATALTLAGSPGWTAGDRVVLASTDFDPAEAEEAVVTAASGNQITLQAGLKHEHWGTLQTIAGRVVDERAEVALLTRNIVIRGDSATSTGGFGGHVIVLQGGTARVEGVSFLRMGQSGKVGRYPFHWHLAGDVTGQYIRDVAIWKTNNRCLTIHGTDRAVAERNVCYDHLGHGYFLEDGAETGNRLEANLGLSARIPATNIRLLGSDASPSTFWITNPDNLVRGNAAAGSVGFGFWYALPAAPTGLSTGQPDLPRRTPLGEFSDNVAHSNRKPGLNVDDGPKTDGTTETTNYGPREGAVASGAVRIAVFRNFVGWKHTGRAVWLRGQNLRMEGGVLADNLIGATFAASETFFERALVVGESDNRTPSPNATFPIRGYEFYDGTVGASDVTFANFVTTPSRPASALGYNRKNGFPISQFNYGTGLRLVNANVAWLEAPAADKDGDRAALFRDTDGSVTGQIGATVVADVPLLVTPACTRRGEWNAWLCAGRYAGLSITSDGSEPIAPLTLRRDDAVTAFMVGVPGNPRSVQMSVVPGRGYEIIPESAPPRPRVTLQRAEAGDWIRVTLRYAGGAPFNVIRDFATGAPLPAAASLAEVENGQGERWWWDAAAGAVVVKLYVRTGRTSTTIQVVPK